MVQSINVPNISLEKPVQLSENAAINFFNALPDPNFDPFTAISQGVERSDQRKVRNAQIEQAEIASEVNKSKLEIEKQKIDIEKSKIEREAQSMQALVAATGGGNQSSGGLFPLGNDVGEVLKYNKLFQETQKLQSDKKKAEDQSLLIGQIKTTVDNGDIPFARKIIEDNLHLVVGSESLEAVSISAINKWNPSTEKGYRDKYNLLRSLGVEDKALGKIVESYDRRRFINNENFNNRNQQNADSNNLPSNQGTPLSPGRQVQQEQGDGQQTQNVSTQENLPEIPQEPTPRVEKQTQDKKIIPPSPEPEQREKSNFDDPAVRNVPPSQPRAGEQDQSKAMSLKERVRLKKKDLEQKAFVGTNGSNDPEEIDKWMRAYSKEYRYFAETRDWLEQPNEAKGSDAIEPAVKNAFTRALSQFDRLSSLTEEEDSLARKAATQNGVFSKEDYEKIRESQVEKKQEELTIKLSTVGKDITGIAENIDQAAGLFGGRLGSDADRKYRGLLRNLAGNIEQIEQAGVARLIMDEVLTGVKAYDTPEEAKRWASLLSGIAGSPNIRHQLLILKGAKEHTSDALYIKTQMAEINGDVRSPEARAIMKDWHDNNRGMEKIYDEETGELIDNPNFRDRDEFLEEVLGKDKDGNPSDSKLAFTSEVRKDLARNIKNNALGDKNTQAAELPSGKVVVNRKDASKIKLDPTKDKYITKIPARGIYAEDVGRYVAPVSALKAMIVQESSAYPLATNDKTSAGGLFALSNGAVKDYYREVKGVNDPTQPQIDAVKFSIDDSIEAGTWYFNKGLNIYKGDMNLAFAGYFAGIGNVNKAIAKAYNKEPGEIKNLREIDYDVVAPVMHGMEFRNQRGEITVTGKEITKHVRDIHSRVGQFNSAVRKNMKADPFLIEQRLREASFGDETTDDMEEVAISPVEQQRDEEIINEIPQESDEDQDEDLLAEQGIDTGTGGQNTPDAIDELNSPISNEEAEILRNNGIEVPQTEDEAREIIERKKIAPEDQDRLNQIAREFFETSPFNRGPRIQREGARKQMLNDAFFGLPNAILDKVAPETGRSFREDIEEFREKYPEDSLAISFGTAFLPTAGGVGLVKGAAKLLGGFKLGRTASTARNVDRALTGLGVKGRIVEGLTEGAVEAFVRDEGVSPLKAGAYGAGASAGLQGAVKATPYAVGLMKRHPLITGTLAALGAGLTGQDMQGAASIALGTTALAALGERFTPRIAAFNQKLLKQGGDSLLNSKLSDEEATIAFLSDKVLEATPEQLRAIKTAMNKVPDSGEGLIDVLDDPKLRSLFRETAGSVVGELGEEVSNIARARTLLAAKQLDRGAKKMITEGTGVDTLDHSNLINIAKEQGKALNPRKVYNAIKDVPTILEDLKINDIGLDPARLRELGFTAKQARSGSEVFETISRITKKKPVDAFNKVLDGVGDELSLTPDDLEDFREVAATYISPQDIIDRKVTSKQIRQVTDSLKNDLGFAPGDLADANDFKNAFENAANNKSFIKELNKAKNAASPTTVLELRNGLSSLSDSIYSNKEVKAKFTNKQGTGSTIRALTNAIDKIDKVLETSHPNFAIGNKILARKKFTEELSEYVENGNFDKAQASLESINFTTAFRGLDKSEEGLGEARRLYTKLLDKTQATTSITDTSKSVNKGLSERLRNRISQANRKIGTLLEKSPKGYVFRRLLETRGKFSSDILAEHIAGLREAERQEVFGALTKVFVSPDRESMNRVLDAMIDGAELRTSDSSAIGEIVNVIANTNFSKAFARTTAREVPETESDRVRSVKRDAGITNLDRETPFGVAN